MRPDKNGDEHDETIAMPKFNRHDICAAYAALEYDWNVGGWLRERPSNRRRMESIGVQLHRIGFKPALDQAAGFHALVKSDSGENCIEIYLDALHRMGLGPDVHPSDEIAAYLSENYDPAWVSERFPRVGKVAPRNSMSN